MFNAGVYDRVVRARALSTPREDARIEELAEVLRGVRLVHRQRVDDGANSELATLHQELENRQPVRVSEDPKALSHPFEERIGDKRRVRSFHAVNISLYSDVVKESRSPGGQLFSQPVAALAAVGARFALSSIVVGPEDSALSSLGTRMVVVPLALLSRMRRPNRRRLRPLTAMN